MCERVSRLLCASSYVVTYAFGVLTFVSNLLDLSLLNGLLISCINQVNCEHICVCTCTSVSVHTFATHQPSLCLYTLGVCALGRRAERGEEVEETSRGM